MTEAVFPDRVPVLTDGHVRLRAHRPEDLPRLVEQCRDPQAVRWTTVPRPYAEADAAHFLALVEAGWNDEGGDRLWALEDAADPGRGYLGTVDLRPRLGGAVAELGYLLHPDARGRGYMAAAVRLVVAWFLEQGGHRVHWRAERGNFASWRVAWACGFTHHGTLPGSLEAVGGGPPLDAWQASVGPEDVLEARTPWPEPPVLRTDEAGGLVLRPWLDEDVDALEPRDQPAHHMPARGILEPDTFPAWLLTRREKMALGTTLSWCVADAATGRALGEALVFVHEGTLDDDTAELGYQVLPSARRRGVATAAARLVAQHALAPRADGGMGLRRLVAQTAEDNVGSNAVLDAAGFEIWGRETEADLLPGGRTVESLHWERLRPWTP
ncbi:GNAT N-acetyltransferase [Phycicoccus sp. MAQZ13P-2]|uniref:GNAT family N-acetyltransferase n=1 Tax=Phycicoccus mangrovi TaxID=2840470 RepID=UPI001BFFE9B7|nr:GNAT family N-acetyltransferase [Phycicoccus mangrovi]MBT9255892.1 GNAT N-acetyltransferase [Phycicoccus mangrovi]MBT9274486.1 GNAT N-acetyltransferase [Phycicoccus mangrovi]